MEFIYAPSLLDKYRGADRRESLDYVGQRGRNVRSLDSQQNLITGKPLDKGAHLNIK